VVVADHVPSSQSVHPRYASDLLTPAFASDLEGLSIPSFDLNVVPVLNGVFST
jgi:hypothetical protein